MADLARTSPLRIRYRQSSMNKLNKSPFSRTSTLLLRVVALVVAVFVVPADASDWRGGVEGGTVVGESGSQTRLRFNLSNDTRPLTHQIYAEWLRGQDGKDGYSVGYNPRYWFGRTYYLFGESRLRTDEAFAIDREILLLAGAGARIIESDTQALFAEIGLGSRRLEFEMQDEATTQGLGVARLGYFRVLADLFKVDLDVSGVVGEDDITEYNGEAGVSMRIPSGAIRYAYRTRSIKIGDNDAVTDDSSYLSFTYGF